MNDSRRCKAKCKASGSQCKKSAILGGNVCQKHGGGSPQVKAKAAERLADLIDPDRALREAARLAYSDLGEVLNDEGNLRPIKEWPEDLRRAVSGFEVVRRNVDSGDGHTDDVIKVKLWDKSKNLEMLFKHLGLLVDKVEMKIEGDIEARLQEARKRAASGKRG